MEQRTFQFDGQWNIVYYPVQPSGFGVLIIGDRTHFVEDNTSYWLQHPGRKQILDHLKSAGYVLFSSNLYGANWGSAKSADLAAKLYHMMMKSEILNQNVHILAEGSGALTALSLMEKMGDHIRSAVFINPTLFLKQKMDKEKENVFFYKKWLHEAAEANEMTPKEYEALISSKDNIPQLSNVPLKIIQVLERTDEKLHKLYRELQNREGKEVDITYLLPEKRYKIASQIQRFFKRYEGSL